MPLIEGITVFKKGVELNGTAIQKIYDHVSQGGNESYFDRVFEAVREGNLAAKFISGNKPKKEQTPEDRDDTEFYFEGEDEEFRTLFKGSIQIPDLKKFAASLEEFIDSHGACEATYYTEQIMALLNGHSMFLVEVDMKLTKKVYMRVAAENEKEARIGAHALLESKPMQAQMKLVVAGKLDICEVSALMTESQDSLYLDTDEYVFEAVSVPEKATVGILDP